MAEPTKGDKIRAILKELDEWESQDKDGLIEELLTQVSEAMINSVYERQVLKR